MRFDTLKIVIHDVLDGLGSGRVPPDAAFNTMHMAAVGKEDPEACYHLARFYRDGVGCESDSRKAQELLRASAEGGWPEAQRVLGMIFFEGDDKDYKEGVRWLAAAAENGDKEAAMYLADRYFDGKGVERDVDRALEWMVKADLPDDWDADSLFGDDDINEDEVVPSVLEEGTPLYVAAVENGFLSMEDREKYALYDMGNRGCSMENPFVISETEDYVPLEYKVLDLILFQNPYRMTADEIKLQEFVEEDGRCFDIITVGVLDFDEDEDQERMEKYYFDITAGYQKMMREM